MLALVWRSTSKTKRKVEPGIVSHLADQLNFREKFVRGQPAEWKTLQLHRRLLRPPLNMFIDDVLREWLILKHQNLICAVLDGEGTPHQDVWIDENARVPTADDFVRGLLAVRERFPARELLIYYGVQLCTNTEGHWAALEEASNRPEFNDLLKVVVTTNTASKTKSSADAAAKADLPAQAEVVEGFTTLDNLLIRTIVAAANDTEGALSHDALKDLVQEVLALSSDRHRSFFHLGYLDSVLKKPFREELTGSNAARRGWYLVGQLMGRLRFTSTSEVVCFLKSKLKEWEELLDQGPTSARVMVLPHLTSHFAEAGEWQLLERMFRRMRLPHDPAAARSTCITIYEHAADLVRFGQATEAIPLLLVLREHAQQASHLGGGFQRQMCGLCARKLGQAHLRNGRFSEAKALLKEALENTHFPESANAMTDLALAEAGFRSLDFVLPREDVSAAESDIKALEKQLPRLQESLSRKGRATNAHFVLGIIAIHRGRLSDAEQHFSGALEGMLEKEEAYQKANLVDWVRFLLAVAIAEQCEPARLNEVRARTESSISSAASFPLRLWTRLCQAALLYDDKSVAEQILEHLLSKRGDAAYVLLKSSGLLFKNPSMRASYRRWLNQQKLSPSQRLEDMRVLLAAAFKSGDHDEIAETLDALEGVAKSDTGCVGNFISLLKDRRADLLAVWTEDDIDATEAGLLERLGKLPECAEVLQRIFYRHRAEGDWEMVEDIIAQIEHLKVEGFDTAKLREQVEHLRPMLAPSTEAPSVNLSGFQVLYIGGHETQMRYEAEIQQYFRERHPGLKVDLYFPGWDSNWIDHFERLEKLIPQRDVVVINNFVRTQLGRKLRAACDSNTPWRACTGHGRKSLIQAIETAAVWAVKRPKKVDI